MFEQDIQISDEELAAVREKLQAFERELPAHGGTDWQLCRANWIGLANLALRKLDEVIQAREFDLPLVPAYHGQIICNCKCIIEDFHAAKARSWRA